VDVEAGPFPVNKGANADISRLETALRKTGNTPFKTRKVDFDGNFEVMVKAAEINEMRRRALSKLEETLVIRRSAGPQPEYVPLKYQSPLEAVELYYYTWEAYLEHFVPEYAEYLDVPKVSLIPAVEFERHFDELGGELVIPYISSVSRGQEDRFIEEHFDSLAAHCADRGIYVGNLSWIQPFRAAGVDVFGDHGLNVLNEQAAAALDAIGVRRCADSLEAAAADQGTYPLMTMQHQPAGDHLAVDGKAGLSIIRRDFSDQTILVPDKSAAT
jgi:putative protease